MNTRKIFIPVVLAMAVIAFSQCTKDEPKDDQVENILPGNFKVDIPSSISNEMSAKKKSSGVDTLDGNEIYEHLTTFIAVGEGSAEIVNEIITAISVYKINRPMSLSFTGDDGKPKNLEVVEKTEYDSRQWEYGMTITDAESENNADGGKGLQVFWNRNPVEGIAILKPVNIDANEDPELGNALFRIDYSEAGNMGYEAHMIVSITDLPLPSPLADPFAMKTLKMFAGINGDVVEVYGNSDHPNANFFSTESGFNWAFAAAGDEGSEYGVAELGLPPSNADISTREAILGQYAIKNVFENEIYATWPGIDSSDVSACLHNTGAPGYFDGDGFIQGGTSPGAGWNDLEAKIQNLTPYNPSVIQSLSIAFKD